MLPDLACRAHTKPIVSEGSNGIVARVALERGKQLPPVDSPWALKTLRPIGIGKSQSPMSASEWVI
jgi:hypothetical protein